MNLKSARRQLVNAAKVAVWLVTQRHLIRLLSIQKELNADLSRLWEIGQSHGLPEPIGLKNFSLPSLNDAVVSPIGPRGTRNWLIFTAGTPWRLATKIRFDNDCTNNVIIFGGNVHYPEAIHFQGNDCTLVWGANIPWPANVTIRFSSHRQLLFWGAGSTSNGTSIILEGEQRRVIIGDDCMFAVNTKISTSDLHAIVDIERGEWINPPADVLVGEHVWIGQDSLLLKGVKIGHGSIIGAKALVSKPVPPQSLAAGIPAKILKSGVTWDRARQPLLPIKNNDKALNASE